MSDPSSLHGEPQLRGSPPLPPPPAASQTVPSWHPLCFTDADDDDAVDHADVGRKSATGDVALSPLRRTTGVASSTNSVVPLVSASSASLASSTTTSSVALPPRRQHPHHQMIADPMAAVREHKKEETHPPSSAESSVERRPTRRSTGASGSRPPEGAASLWEDDDLLGGGRSVGVVLPKWDIDGDDDDDDDEAVDDATGNVSSSSIINLCGSSWRRLARRGWAQVKPFSDPEVEEAYVTFAQIRSQAVSAVIAAVLGFVYIVVFVVIPDQWAVRDLQPINTYGNIAFGIASLIVAGVLGVCAWRKWLPLASQCEAALALIAALFQLNNALTMPEYNCIAAGANMRPVPSIDDCERLRIEHTAWTCLLVVPCGMFRFIPYGAALLALPVVAVPVLKYAMNPRAYFARWLPMFWVGVVALGAMLFACEAMRRRHFRQFVRCRRAMVSSAAAKRRVDALCREMVPDHIIARIRGGRGTASQASADTSAGASAEDAAVAAASSTEAMSPLSASLFLPPSPTASSSMLLSRGGAPIRDAREGTVLFSDLVSFTTWCSSQTAKGVITMLCDMVCRFDSALSHYHVHKLATIGDAYWAECGVQEAFADHAASACLFAAHMIDEVADIRDGYDIKGIRVGIASGFVDGGVIPGISTVSYQVFGDVNELAEELERRADSNGILISRATAEHPSVAGNSRIHIGSRVALWGAELPQLGPPPAGGGVLPVTDLTECGDDQEEEEEGGAASQLHAVGVHITVTPVMASNSLESLGTSSDILVPVEGAKAPTLKPTAAGRGAVLDDRFNGSGSFGRSSIRTSEMRRRRRVLLGGGAADDYDRTDAELDSVGLLKPLCPSGGGFLDPAMEDHYQAVRLREYLATVPFVHIGFAFAADAVVIAVLLTRLPSDMVWTLLSIAALLIVNVFPAARLAMQEWNVDHRQRRRVQLLSAGSTAAAASAPAGLHYGCLVLSIWVHYVIVLVGPADFWLVSDNRWISLLAAVMLGVHGYPHGPWWTNAAITSILVMLVGVACWTPFGTAKATTYVNQVVNVAVVLLITGYRRMRQQRGLTVDEMTTEVVTRQLQQEKAALEAIMRKAMPAFALEELSHWLETDRAGFIYNVFKHVAIAFVHLRPPDELRQRLAPQARQRRARALLHRVQQRPAAVESDIGGEGSWCAETAELVAGDGDGDGKAASGWGTASPQGRPPLQGDDDEEPTLSPRTATANDGARVDALLRWTAAFHICLEETINATTGRQDDSDDEEVDVGVAPEEEVPSSEKHPTATDRGGSMRVTPTIRPSNHQAGRGGGRGISTTTTMSGDYHTDVVRIKIIGDTSLLAAGLQSKRDVSKSWADASLSESVGNVSALLKRNVLSTGATCREILALADILLSVSKKSGTQDDVTVGIHCGSTAGGVVGDTGLMYDVFGDTVNTASRIMSTAKRPGVFLSDDAFADVHALALKDLLQCSTLLSDGSSLIAAAKVTATLFAGNIMKPSTATVMRSVGNGGLPSSSLLLGDSTSHSGTLSRSAFSQRRSVSAAAATQQLSIVLPSAARDDDSPPAAPLATTPYTPQAPAAQVVVQLVCGEPEHRRAKGKGTITIREVFVCERSHQRPDSIPTTPSACHPPHPHQTTTLLPSGGRRGSRCGAEVSHQRRQSSNPLDAEGIGGRGGDGGEEGEFGAGSASSSDVRDLPALGAGGSTYSDVSDVFMPANFMPSMVVLPPPRHPPPQLPNRRISALIASS